VCDSVRVAALLEELECELGDYYERHGRQFDDISKKSRIKTDPTQADKATDVNHIEFVLPENNNEQVKEYTQFISRECYIRGIPLQASHLEDWITSLKACIAMENWIRFLLQVREWHSKGHEVVPLVEVIELLIPCVLHLENRANEKNLTSIVRFFFQEFLKTCGTDVNAKNFIHSLQGVIQKHVLGTVEAPSQ
jgi:hypothetical protein